MTLKKAKLLVVLVIIIALLAVSGCIFSMGRSDATPTPTPVPATPTPPASPGIGLPVPSPGSTVIWTPGSGDVVPGNTTPSNGTVTPVISATASNWGTSASTYNRGDTATGWVDITNTGNVAIDSLNFHIVIKRTVYFVPVEKDYDYSKTSLGIQPGETKRVEFSVEIPAEYQGVSTAGDYQLTATAQLDGNDLSSSYSTSLKVV